MGIKGIYGEIGPGERIAFSKLAVEKLEKTGEPFRVAIDVSIWQFQTQAGQGGSNPAIRTFYYRLLRLLSIAVQPIFIFDGPHKPPFKRGKKSGHHGASVPNMLTKQMLTLFGFPFYQAPGEAEAECALLQREGIVDAVLSEDVDTLMFGCEQTLRNWSSEGTRGNKSPTHVSVYNAKATKDGSSGLDREGMVLVALMSGGDYITEGIPGCGIKVACQAARAGYGKSLCQISRTDVAGLEAWRQDLKHELQTNERKHFRNKHKALKIPDTFPDREVLGYYTHPVVSSAIKIQKIKDETAWDGHVDVPGLRLFVADAFEWTNKIGAIKFIRGLAPVLLVQKFLLRRNRRDSGYGDLVLTAINEMELVRAIAANRNHFSTDGLRELRLVYMPIDIVKLDLDAEYDDRDDYGRDGLAPVGEDDQIEGFVSDDAGKIGSPTRRAPSQYDPTQPDKVWVPATVVRIGVPLKVEDYEESLKDPKKFIKAKSAAKKAAAKKPIMPKGALDRFVTISKPGMGTKTNAKSFSQSFAGTEDSLPPTFLAPSLEREPLHQTLSNTGGSRETRSSKRPSIDLPLPGSKATTKTRSGAISKASKAAMNTNPWSMATTSQTSPPIVRVTKSLAAGTRFKSTQPVIYNLLSSSPMIPSPPSIITKASTPKRQHSPSPPESPSPLPRSIPAYQRDSLESLEAHQELGLPDTITISRHRSGRSRQHHRSQNASRAHTPSRAVELQGYPSPGEEDNQPPLEHLNSIETGLGEELRESTTESIARKLDFGTATTSVSVVASSLTLSTFDSVGSQNLDLGLDPEPDLEPEDLTLPPQHRTSPTTPEKGAATEIIDISSSPPISFPPPPQPLPRVSTYTGESKIHTFFNTSKASQLNSSSSDKKIKSTNTSITSSTNTIEAVAAAKTKPKNKKGKYIMLRESLPGAWKELDETELEGRDNHDGDRPNHDQSRRRGEGEKGGGGGGVMARARREGMWRMSQVEMLDLTSAD